MRHIFGYATALLSVLALGCGSDDSDSNDDTTGGNTDTATTGASTAPQEQQTGDAGMDDETLDTDAAAQEIQTAESVITPMMGIAGPLVAAAESSADSDGTDEAALQGVAEDAISENSIVTVPECVTYDWHRLTGTVAMTDCVMETSGLTISGTATVSLSVLPATVTLSFTDLTVGGRKMSGEVSVSRAKDLAEPGVILNATISLQQKDGDLISLTITGATLTMTIENLEPQAYILNGNGSITSDLITAPFSAMNVNIKVGDCSPSSGSLNFTTDNSTIMTFLDKTPSTGIVLISTTVGRRGKVVEEEVQALDPC